jgi:transposase
VAASISLPAGPLLDAASWAQTPFVVCHLILQLLEVIQHLEARVNTLEARIAALEAHLQQRSRNSDRPPSSDPPYEKRPARSGSQGKPGARPGHLGHRQALLEPTAVIEVKPERCPCGQTEFPEMHPYSTHQVIELPEIQMIVRHVVLHEARCPLCGRVAKAQVPLEAQAGHGPRLTALIGERSGPQRDSRRAVQECCQSVLGVRLSRGAVQRAVDRVSEAITPHYAAIAAKARLAPVNFIDETAWYQHGVLAWLWVMVRRDT